MSEHSSPRRLGKYRVLKELGCGAFGITSLAEHVSLNTRVVLKELIASAAGDPTTRDRFFQEARVQAKLSALNPGIAQVTELEEDATPPYYVVEYCDQGDLASLTQEYGPWPVGHVVWVIRQVAAALVCVHQEMCHRDIKPHNLVLSSSYKADGEAVVKLIDFGLARLHGQKELDNPMLTQAGQMLGTVLFSAPEQLRNEATLDGRCDLFSLGVTAWFLLEGSSPLRGSSGELLAERLSEGSYGEALPKNLPEPVRQLLIKLLAKNPADRPKDAKAVVCEADFCLNSIGFIWQPLINHSTASGTKNIPLLYEVSSNISSGNWGHSLMATVRTNQRPVHLWVLPRLDPGTIARVYQSAGRIRETRCPYLPQFQVELLEEGMVVAEEILLGATDLTEVIRETHAQALPQCVRLLRALADACDAVKMAELVQFPLSVKSVQVAVDERRFNELIPTGKFIMRLRSDFKALLPNQSSAADQTDLQGTLRGTLVGGGDASLLTVPQRFLRIVYWILSGREPRATAYWCATDCDPIRGLNEECNVIIRRYLAGGALPEEFPCSNVLEQICHAQGVAYPASDAGNQVTYLGGGRTSTIESSLLLSTSEQPTEVGPIKMPAIPVAPALPMPVRTSVIEPKRMVLPPSSPALVTPPSLAVQSRGSGMLLLIAACAVLLLALVGSFVGKVEDGQDQHIVAAEVKAKQARADADAKAAAAALEEKNQANERTKAKDMAEAAKKRQEAEQAKQAEDAKKAALKRSFTKENPFRNSLGMEFVPVPNTKILASNAETRVKDFEAFVAAKRWEPNDPEIAQFLKSELNVKTIPGSWRSPGFEQSPDHPVAGLTWYAAREFCVWLSKQEAPRKYRLPTSEEWTAAVAGTEYVYGDNFPPHSRSGNLFGKEWIRATGKSNLKALLTGDEFLGTSPARSFPANALGIYDLAGNLWEWCADDFVLAMNLSLTKELGTTTPSVDAPSGSSWKVIRGGSWFNYQELYLKTNFINRQDPSKGSAFIGFRTVVEVDSL